MISEKSDSTQMSGARFDTNGGTTKWYEDEDIISNDDSGGVSETNGENGGIIHLQKRSHTDSICETPENSEKVRIHPNFNFFLY